MKTLKLISFLLVLVFVGGCGTQVQTPSSEQPFILTYVPVKILISEVLAGIDGNNQADYIELYNTGTEIADLNGYSLWFQLNDGADEIKLVQWNETTLIPPMGFYALTLEGQDFPVLHDKTINQPLVPTRGGLSLRKGDLIEDQLTWGTGPIQMAEGSPADPMLPGTSLERNLAASDENMSDTGDNQTDFHLNSSPALKNSGSPINHSAATDLELLIDFPEVVKPGEEFIATLNIQNNTGIPLENLLVTLPLPENMFFDVLTSEFKLEGNILSSVISRLNNGEKLIREIPLRADYTFADFALKNSYLEAGNWPLPAFNGPFFGEIGGGPIPIATARELIDKEVVVKGISTMYVGGFYAGSGAKFYLEDDSGGVQVYVSGAGATLNVPLGSTVQVRGKIELYRDSIELIPSTEDYVEIITGPGDSAEKAPEPITIEEINSNGVSQTGKLLQVEGRIARLEEFSYSYEIDLFDEIGNLATLYIDKETGITLEEIEADDFYKVTAIMELLDANLRLYPRLQSDFVRIYEPGLAIQVNAPTNANPGEPFDINFTVTNHSPDPDQNLVISVKVDPQLEVLEVHDQGRMNNNTIVWDMDKMPGGGEEISVSYQAQLKDATEYIIFDDYRVISSTWSQSQHGITSYTFPGETVPIWAIQGTGTKSSYILEKLTTQGVVTGVFPDLEGFWIQEKESDDDPSTSPGLFIRTGLTLPDIKTGDLVLVTGRVREAFQQTELELLSSASIEVVGRNSLPDPVKLDPPVDNEASLDYYESLEGVLVSVLGPATVVGPTTRYGEFSIILAKHEMTRSWQNDDHGMLIHVDDGTSFTHQTRDTMDSAVSVGDQVFQIVGPLAFTFGNYKIEPISEFPTQAKIHELSPLEPLEAGYFSIMTWNVENLFDFVVPHPSSPPLPRVSEYKQSISKVALTIQAAGYPTLIGFQEVENLGILEDIAADPVLADYPYQAVLIEGTDSRGIDVGYLVREDQALIVDQVQYPAPGNITSRPPLLVEVQLGEAPGQTLYVLNNHFTSMSGGELATEPRRNAQAAWNLEIALELMSDDPLAPLAIIGDLNSYYNSLPIITIREGGFQSVFDSLDPEERYTYVYEGNSQVLDHILMNESLQALLVSVNVLHSNADFTLPYSNDESLIHISDHDPVIAVFVLP